MDINVAEVLSGHVVDFGRDTKVGCKRIDYSYQCWGVYEVRKGDGYQCRDL